MMMSLAFGGLEEHVRKAVLRAALSGHSLISVWTAKLSGKQMKKPAARKMCL